MSDSTRLLCSSLPIGRAGRIVLPSTPIGVSGSVFDGIWLNLLYYKS